MSLRSPDALRRYYDSRLAAHGDTAQGAGWPNEADRQTRFAVMRALAPDGRMEDLCDLACGTGAFLDHLHAAATPPARYLGLDISETAIATARAKHGADRFAVHDLLADPVPGQFDYVVANGLFTVKDSLSAAEMWDFLRTATTAMWDMTRVGMAFNVMSAVVDWQREDLFHVEADALLRWLYALAGRRVILRADYDLYEYTAYVYRAPLATRPGQGF
ncbi:class I SAM-dependent methyltransferase [Dinoroseobacter sp. PD6]|uniref:class I SAM-dependent methyltransferase n=1 Tax=Dinoroseobacter sp. PD6 TaxID=3028384 RepID=UPI00237A12C5|nr:class I SAM-dependent methyltransferase [Dinoroseobacter sp. PD6]MDD9718296.1 class I SAM-dependent methyltransferase [Dinoroseobacter sp. PD6]